MRIWWQGKLNVNERVLYQGKTWIVLEQTSVWIKSRHSQNLYYTKLKAV